MRKLRWVLRAVLLVAALSGPGVAAVAEDDCAEGRRANASQSIGGRTLTLSASLWRDCMPSIQPAKGCRPIQGVVAVTAEDGKAFLAGLRIDHVWLESAGRSWDTATIEEQDAEDPSHSDTNGVPRNRLDSSSFRIALRNGPDWEMTSKVDVIVRLVDASGREYHLRIVNQPVERVS